jgi:hypothetical protein
MRRASGARDADAAAFQSRSFDTHASRLREFARDDAMDDSRAA